MKEAKIKECCGRLKNYKIATTKMKRLKHKILSRNWGYVSMDCYGYEAKCSCGKIITGWSEKECEDDIEKHLLEKQR